MFALINFSEWDTRYLKTRSHKYVSDNNSVNVRQKSGNYTKNKTQTAVKNNMRSRIFLTCVGAVLRTRLNHLYGPSAN